MPHADRLKVVHHGAIVMLIGLLCGLPTTLEEEPTRFWHTAHETTVFIGILMFAMSSVLPHLKLEAREARALVVSLLMTGYGLATGLIVQAVIGQHAFGPSKSPVLMFGFLASTAGMLGSVLTPSLTIMGARAARAGVAAALRGSVAT